jgi:protein-export membrane protein SecD
MKGLTWRTTLVAFTVVFGVYLLIPSIIKFTTNKTVPRIAKADDPWYYHIIPSESLKLGLDLKGGLHLVLGVDFDEVQRDAVEKIKSQLNTFLTEDKIEGVTIETTPNYRVKVQYGSSDQWKKIEDVIQKHLSQMVDFDSQTQNTVLLKMTEDWNVNVKKRAIDQSLETLRNRIDEFGIAEPAIQPQGEDKIMIQFPGVDEKELGRIKEIISRTAKLTFQIVKTSPELQEGTPSYADLKKMISEFETAKNMKIDPNQPINKYLRELNAFVAAKLPPNSELLFHKETNINTKETTYVPYLVEKEHMAGGEDLEDAYYAFDQQTGDPEVLFRMNAAGAQKFGKGTGANVGKYMAIVLDSNVHSAPVIQSRIESSGRITLGSRGGLQDKTNEAKDTALVLRSGALPARLEFLEERVIGPALGADAIRAGTSSLIAGLILVLFFMSIYYRVSGLISVIALSLNGLFIFSILAAFEGTLSLPGLAGITLTLGMAIDANVLIFEHIREELRAGKSVNMAISEGYTRAFSAIFDSHFTSVVAAMVLLRFGYGPIRGFAVTLLIGLVASLYTSVFVTRVIFDYFYVSKSKQTISV